MNKKNLVCSILLAVSLFSSNLYAQKTAQKKDSPTVKYDAKLAEKLGANEYGMKVYVLVILKTGEAKITDKEEISKLQAGHMQNIGRLAEAGKLVLAGPFMNGKEKRGIFVFDVRTIEEAKQLVETDPAIKAKLFEAEFISWYASAALLEVVPTHKKISKKNP